MRTIKANVILFLLFVGLQLTTLPIQQPEYCGICFEKIKRADEEAAKNITTCRHIFHEQCIEPWAERNPTCPECRAPLNEDYLQTIRSEEVPEQESINSLVRAARYGDIQTMRSLLDESNLDLNRPDDFGESPLIAAANAKQLEAVEWLLDQPGIDVNQRSLLTNDETALMIAARDGDTDIVRALIQKEDTDPNVHSNYGGKTALMYAIIGQHHDIVDLLLDKPSLDLDIEARANNNRTALWFALDHKNYEGAVELLNSPRLQSLDVSDFDTHHQDDLSYLFLLAANQGHDEMIRKLLPIVDINTQDEEQGATALMHAISKGHRGIVELLLRDPRINIHLPDPGGNTAFDYVGDNTEMQQLLMRYANRCDRTTDQRRRQAFISSDRCSIQ